MIKETFGLALVVVMAMMLIAPAFAPDPIGQVRARQMVHEKLFVNGYTADYTKWAEFGSSPYLHDDDTSNYVASPVATWNPKWEGRFTFADTSWYQVNSATLFFKAKVMSSYPPVSFDVLDGNGYYINSIEPATTSYQWYSFDMSDWLTNPTQVNNFAMILSYALGPQKAQGEQLLTSNILYITCSYLEITYPVVSGTTRFGDHYAISGTVKVNDVNWYGPGWYWTAFGIISSDENNFVEVGITVHEDGAEPFSHITEIYAYFTAVDDGAEHTWMHNLGVGMVDTFVGLYCFEEGGESNSGIWNAILTLPDHTTVWIKGYDGYPFGEHWKGQAQVTLESDNQPRYQWGRWISEWKDMEVWEYDHGRYDFLPEIELNRYNYPGYFRVAGTLGTPRWWCSYVIP
jgi:hypothetical protein